MREVSDAPLSGGRLTDHIGIGVLTRLVDRDLVDEVLAETGKREQRVRLLPARVVVYYVMALCLFFGDSYEEVMRKLVDGLRTLGSWSKEWRVPTTSAITRARTRLGPEPIRELFERVAVPCARPGVPGAWLGTRRLMAIDGFVLDVPDTPENDEEFGRSGGEKNPAPFPQAHLVGLGECGTHAIIAAEIGPMNTNERKLAQNLLAAFEPGMLVIADRGFYAFQLWTDAAKTGADLLWRMPAGPHLPVVTPLPDGSYLSFLSDPKVRARRAVQKHRGKTVLDDLSGPTVRVVEYEISNRSGSNELFCLITTILDPDLATPVELAEAYGQRWEFETSLDELKTHQRGQGAVLRSRSPDLVKQEIWALLLTHYAVRQLMSEAAEQADIDPDRLSFIRSLRVIRRQATRQAGFSPSAPD